MVVFVYNFLLFFISFLVNDSKNEKLEAHFHDRPKANPQK
jgi:hypothetical protein